ncbi:hypothetical protein V9T40_003414 [Parthenolecanium corni]|uniref:Uncharacterized protein n=1 Tax=Parthenolecanium corni TaxID=536013 RepID=A0AAN9TV97_9HEMI
MDEPDWTTSSSSQSNIDIPEPNNDIPENVKFRKIKEMDVQIAEQYIVYEDINMCPDDPSKWDDENNIPLERLSVHPPFTLAALDVVETSTLADNTSQNLSSGTEQSCSSSSSAPSSSTAE